MSNRLRSAIAVLFLVGWSSVAHAALSVPPGTFDHGNVAIGSTDTINETIVSDALPVSPDSLESIVVTGAGCGTNGPTDPLRITPAMALPQDISNVSSLDITIVFEPANRVAISCTVQLRGNGNALLGSFTVTGDGTGPELTVPAPTTFTAARVTTGATTNADFIIRNTGEANLTIPAGGIAISGANAGDFTFTTPPSLPTTIAPGGTRTVNVTFNPSGTGTRMASLDVMSDDPVVPNKSTAMSGDGTTAEIAVDDPAFGIVDDGTTDSIDITVSNTGASPRGALRVTSATISGGSWFTFDTNGAAACQGDTTCTFNADVTNTPLAVAVRCSPVSSDPMIMQVATVTFTHDGDTQPGDRVAMISCTAGRANIGVSTATLAFGDQLINTSSAAQTVTVSNTGTAALTYSVASTDPFASRYALGGTCHTNCTVQPMTNTSFTVTFTPNAVAQMNITLAFTDNDPDANPSIAVTGRGVAPAISGPANMQFNNVEVGKTSTAQTLTITNTGMAPLNITSAVVQAGVLDYTAVGTAGAQVVMPGGTAMWSLTCHPDNQGANAGNFRILSDANNDTQLDIPLACNGTRGFLTVDPTTHAFGGVPQGTTVNANITLRNTGNLAVTGISAIVNPNNVGYSVVAATMPSMLPAGGMATVQVRFAPTATELGGSATVTFSGSWGTTPQSSTSAQLTVTGNGLTVGYTVTPTTLNFGNFRFDLTPTQTFCISNTSQSSVTIDSPIGFTPIAPTVSSELAITQVRRQTTCGTAGTLVMLPQTLAPGDILQVTVRADPANRVGTLSGSFLVTSNLASSTDVTVNVTGNAITGMYTPDPGPTVNLGDVDIQGGAPSTMLVRLRNTGAAAIDLSNFQRTANPAFTFTLPGNQTVMPGNSVDFNVTYAPTTASASPEAVTVSFSMAGDINMPAMGTVVLNGRGIDRDLAVVGLLPQFPTTFRNPGTDGPVRVVSVQNAGTAPLQIASMTTTMPTVFRVLDTMPVTIPPGAVMDFRVRFEPTMPGIANAKLQIENDDDDDGPPITTKITEVDLTGTCVNRLVDMNDPIINLGFVEIGDSVTLENRLIVTNRDDANDFTIATIEIDNDAFAIVDEVDGITLDQGDERRFDVTFTPTIAGPITAKARLFLDMDTEYQAEVELQGTAVFVDARGGGGCASGHGLGFGAIIFVLAFVLRRRAILLAVLAVAPAARADENVLLSVFDPTPQTHVDGFQLQSGVIGAHGAWSINGVFSYASDPLLHLTDQGGDHSVITSSSMIELGGAVALLGKFELGAAMPFYSQSGEALGDPMVEYTTNPAEGTATGDLRVHGKVSIARKQLEGDGLFALAGSVGLTLPTATDGQLTGADNPAARVLALMTLTPGTLQNRITLSVNAGAVIRAAAKYKNLEQKSGVVWGLGTSIRLADPLWIAGEMFGELVPSGRTEMDGASAVLSPTEWLAGLRWRPDRRFMLSLAAGRGLTSAAGSPALRGVLALTITPRAEAIKSIPRPPEKPDVDTDGDGIFDRADKCDNEAEDLDLFDDSDGCPDLDNDGDGIADATDKCPIEAEDKDNFEDDDGCIDKDNDADGIADAMDKCPLQPEDKDSFQDSDGCPELDNDVDGIADAQDKCPIEKEVVNGVEDNDGCPDVGDALVIITPDRFELMDVIKFKREKLDRASHNLLGQIAATLRANPRIARLQIRVHVSATRDEAKDQQLSEKRGQAIKEWLVQWGVAEKRLDVRAYGSTKPLGGSAAADERIELVIIEKN